MMMLNDFSTLKFMSRKEKHFYIYLCTRKFPVDFLLWFFFSSLMTILLLYLWQASVISAGSTVSGIYACSWMFTVSFMPRTSYLLLNFLCVLNNSQIYTTCIWYRLIICFWIYLLVFCSILCSLIVEIVFLLFLIWTWTIKPKFWLVGNAKEQ